MVLGGIAFVIARTQKSIDKMNPTELEPFDFNTYLSEEVQQSDFNHLSFQQAKEEYERIYDLVKTEAFVTCADSLGVKGQLLDSDSALACYEAAFGAYWPVFQNMVDNLFESDWSRQTERLNDIKAEAENLQQREGISSKADSLNAYIEYVNTFDQVVFWLSNLSCTSSQQYDDLVSMGRRYQRYPLNNNSELLAQLNMVPTTAKNKWNQHVVNNVKATCTTTDLDWFLRCRSNRIKEIEDYQRKTGDDLSGLKTQMKNRWRELLQSKVTMACDIDDINEFNLESKDLYSRIGDYAREYGTEADYLRNQLDHHFNDLRNR